MEKLSRNDLKTFRARLLAERESVLGACSSRLEVLESLGEVSAEDQPPLIHAQAIALQCRSRELEKLGRIEAALDRIRKGTYGICQECEEPISRRRLTAIPWAENCIACQQQLQEGPHAGQALQLAA